MRFDIKEKLKEEIAKFTKDKGEAPKGIYLTMQDAYKLGLKSGDKFEGISIWVDIFFFRSVLVDYDPTERKVNLRIAIDRAFSDN